MNIEKKSEITTTDLKHSRTIYYAPAASTTGDKVKIFGYAFECLNSEYLNHILITIDEVKQAVAKYEWAQFIISQLCNYAGDRSDLFNGAQLMIINAFYTIQRHRYNTNQELKKAESELMNIYRTGDFSKPQIRGALTVTKRRVARSKKAYYEVRANCPDDLFEQIAQQAEIYEYYWS